MGRVETTRAWLIKGLQTNSPFHKYFSLSSLQLLSAIFDFSRFEFQPSAQFKLTYIRLLFSRLYP